ncbi:circadian clock protein, KaiC [Halorubrum californiense DSM 19288]|uniref:non-specific serine/threonine protein kinase n=1 Tax=Halorubrum californiense DSM 19288 TaxID=1227465 RepID=M0EFM5_9EURY|nr:MULTISPECIES: ATPase domain-containing protein [Halorubrum]ELZ45878.1 circadian clock protein, KaiC [Halorubrum californiense DSM 19288]TKX69614.1 recombinase RecA [Halorubrum sp. GN11GM_10-3_MGM]
MTTSLSDRVSTGVDGLDEVLSGGLVPTRSYMVRGQAGSGKTILGFHFLQRGIEEGETALFINLEEDLRDLKANADSLGFDTDAIEFLDLSPGADAFVEDESYEVFAPSEVEREPLTDRIVEGVTAVDPDRVVVDPLTQLRFLLSDDYQFRKQVVGFMRFLKDRGATVLFTVQNTPSLPTDDLEFITDGTIRLDAGAYGKTVSVPKFRGSSTQSGDHAYRITDAGMEVFPALQPGTRETDLTFEQVSSGIPEIDELLHGGIERGTVTIVSGPTGVGKTTLSTQFMKEAAGRGERSVIYLFEENRETFLARSRAVNIPVDEMLEKGTLQVTEVEALERSPQEFARMVRDEVEGEGADIVMIDGIAGYRLTLRGEDEQMLQQMHALGRYLKNAGVTGVFIDETRNVTGEFHATMENISYLADNIVFLRHLEVGGELRKAIGVLKKRTSDFERTIREFKITEHGITVGEPMSGLRGILSGTPEVVERDAVRRAEGGDSDE